MANGWAMVIGFVVVAIASALAWFLSPKGENQTIWRSSLVLTFVACYTMWGIVFMAQLNPLIQPKMTKLRHGYPGGS